MTIPPVIVSFVLRLNQVGEAETEAEGSTWRVCVRHVQTGEEAQFADLNEAFGCIQRWATEALPDAG